VRYEISERCYDIAGLNDLTWIPPWSAEGISLPFHNLLVGQGHDEHHAPFERRGVEGGLRDWNRNDRRESVSRGMAAGF
jgi:hypothetical protein